MSTLLLQANVRRYSDDISANYAEFSECGTYRYVLRRRNDDAPAFPQGPVLFIMLNPSTADENKNDPTIRRCIHFANRANASELMVVNLFALRSTDPRKLLKHKSPIGQHNDFMISELAFHVRKNNGIIVAAWGAHPAARERGEELASKFGPFKNGTLLCLGQTKSGAPRHPLYVKNNQPFEVYR